MKKHAIIPIFIPHKGCNNDCIFCNQHKITANIKEVSPKDVVDIADTWLKTLQGKVPHIEMAFFGGSFTGLDIDDQNKYLEVAKKYKSEGKIKKIHISTRPDYIDEKILSNLKLYGVDIIELGVQSFDNNVLYLSKRGHTAEDVYKSSKIIKEFGFILGIQLMIGLPGDMEQTALYSAHETVKLEPEIARLYPTVIIENTKLAEEYRAGRYKPLEEQEMVRRTAAMYRIIDSAGINIIRVGLKSSDIINDEGAVLGHTYHPAFRQLVEGSIAREEIERKINKLKNTEITSIKLEANPKCFSNLIGHQRNNKEYFANKYSKIKFIYKRNSSLKNGEYKVSIFEND